MNKRNDNLIAKSYWASVEKFSKWKRINPQKIDELFAFGIDVIFKTIILCLAAVTAIIFFLGKEPIIVWLTCCLGVVVPLNVIAYVRIRSRYRKAKDNPEYNTHKAKLTVSFNWGDVSGIVVGKTYRNEYVYSPESEVYMALCIGAPGSGKTTGVVILSIRKWQGTVFAIDIAGDITKNTIKYRDKVNILKIGTDDYSETVSYDIMYDIDNVRNDYERLEAIEILADQLYPDVVNADSTASYYNNEAKNLFIGCFIFFYEEGYDFIDICDLIVSHSGERLMDCIMMGKNATAKTYLSGNIGINSTLMASIKQDCDKAIKRFAGNPVYKTILHRPKNNQQSVNSHSLENGDVFVQVPENKLNVYKSLVSVIVAQNLAYLSNRNGTSPILFMIDEFARLNRMPEITSALMTIRKRNVRILLCVQSISSLYKLYGKYEAKEIIDCCVQKIILKINDRETQEIISRTIGEDYRFVRSERRNKGTNEGYTLRREAERIVAPEEFGFLDKELIFINDTGYERLKKLHYFDLAEEK